MTPEIDRLTRELAELQYEKGQAVVRITELEAENVRLREALKIEVHLEDPLCPLLEFRTKSGNSVCLNILQMIEARKGTITRSILMEWLDDQKA